MVRSHSSQCSPGGSQSSVTPVQGDLNPLLISMGSRHTHGAHTYMLTKTHAQKNKIRESETQSGKSSAATDQLDPHPPYSLLTLMDTTYIQSVTGKSGGEYVLDICLQSTCFSKRNTSAKTAG